MSQPASFLGAWLVSEYVYAPSGEYVGRVRQKRILQPQGETIRVIQHCAPIEPAESLSAETQKVIETMNARTGEYVFDLKMSGKARRYLGPDVLGGGFSWMEGVLTARGIWPRFGYNFTSFSILLTPRRQVTGGRFFIANQEAAVIVGAATPEDEGFPSLQPLASLEGAQGEQFVLSPEGELLETLPISASALAFEEIAPLTGRIRRYGALREIEAVSAPGETLSWLEVSDAQSGMAAGLRKRIRDEKLHSVEVYVLNQPTPTP